MEVCKLIGFKSKIVVLNTKIRLIIIKGNKSNKQIYRITLCWWGRGSNLGVCLHNVCKLMNEKNVYPEV